MGKSTTEVLSLGQSVTYTRAYERVREAPGDEANERSIRAIRSYWLARSLVCAHVRSWCLLCVVEVY